MIKVIGVRFRTAGKIYFFDPVQFEIKKGDHVIVETARGIEFGSVVSGVMEVEDEKVVQPLKPVIRIANEHDLEQEAANKGKEKDAFKICLEKIHKHGLEMKLIDAEYTFDNNKVLFYFTADGRIDFRELVKDLASVFKTRIELRQIGVRDETKIVGGIGICGRPLCCHSYLSDFIPVSIKMAKEQNLSLNPTKISGVCGRLMCCLKNEEETYEELNRRLPNTGDYVTTDDGLKGEVQSVNVLRQLVRVVVEEGDAKEIKEYPVDRLQFKRKRGKKEKLDLTKEEKLELTREEMQELERLEEEQQELKEGGAGALEEPGQNAEQRRPGRERQNNRSRESRDRQDNGNRGRESWDRQDGGNRSRESWDRQDNGNRGRESWDRQDGGNRGRESWDRQDNGNRGRQDNKGRSNNPRQHQDQGGRQFRENKNRPNNRNRQNVPHQGSRNQQEARNRADRRQRQEGQAGRDDS